MNTENNLEIYNAELKKELERVKAELELERSTNAKNRERFEKTMKDIEKIGIKSKLSWAEAQKMEAACAEKMKEVLELRDTLVELNTKMKKALFMRGIR